MNSTSNPRTASRIPLAAPPARALVIRVGALGDILLTRRLTYSLSLAGFRSTLLAPVRSPSLLLADSWIEAVLDSESPRFAEAFQGSWPEAVGAFDLALVISNSAELADAAQSAARKVLRIGPMPTREDTSIAAQWAEAASDAAPSFTGVLPDLRPQAPCAVLAGASLIHPGSGSPRKNWPLARYVELSRVLQARGHRVVWIRGPAEVAQPEAWDGELVDRPSVQTLAATLAVARIFVGNDSGVSHLAAAMGAPTLTLFGPTRQAVWRPDGRLVQTVSSATDSIADLPLEAVVAGVATLEAAAVTRATQPDASMIEDP